MKSLEIILGKNFSETEKPEHLFSGHLELDVSPSSLIQDTGFDNDNPIILRISLERDKFNEILTMAGKRRKRIRLFLCNSENNTSPANSLTEEQPAKYRSGLRIRYPLTECQKGIWKCLADGYKYKDIALIKFISINTVKRHVSDLYAILDVHNRTMAAAKYLIDVKNI